MLSRKEVEDKSICMKCQFCKQEAIEHAHWTEYRHFCTNSIVHVDPVTGDETYASCCVINTDGSCSAYSRPKLTRFEQFLELITGKKTQK